MLPRQQEERQRERENLPVNIHDDGDLERRGWETFDDIVDGYGRAVAGAEDDEERAEGQDHVVEMIPADVSQSGNGKCADGVVSDGILDTGSENPKADWRRGRDDEDRIKAVLETPGTPPTTRYA